MSNKAFTATLVRGTTYTVGNTKYENGKPRPVTSEEKVYLEESAFDELTLADPDSESGNVNIKKPKFTFQEISEDGDDVEGETKAKKPRARVAPAPAV